MTASERKPRSPAPFVLLVVLIALAVGGRWWWTQKHKPAEPTAFHGNVDIHDVTLAFRIGGRIDAVLKREGDRVQPGEVLARLDGAPYRVALDQARSTVAVARAQLKRVEAGARREDVAEAKARLAERIAAREHAEDTLKRIEPLASSGAITEQAFTDAKSGAEQARAAVTAAEASVTRLLNGTRVEDIVVARAQVAQAEAAIEAAELSLADTELKASTGGVVVTRAIEPGAIVAAGSPALVIAFDDPVWVRAFASEADLARLAPGTLVEVTTDARPGHPYEGQIGYVATQAEFTPKNVETAELRTSLVYRFRVIVTAHDGGLRQGMPVTVRLRSAGPPPPASSSASALQGGM